MRNGRGIRRVQGRRAAEQYADEMGAAADRMGSTFGADWLDEPKVWLQYEEALGTVVMRDDLGVLRYEYPKGHTAEFGASAGGIDGLRALCEMKR